MAVDANYIYMADTDNHRVQIFDRNSRTYIATIGNGWGSENTEFEHPGDVAVDAAGNIYVADYGNERVQQFNSSRAYVRTYGVTGKPYLTDGQHYNGPKGVAVTAEGEQYIIEDRGYRLLKLNAAGAVQWTVGEAGLSGGWDGNNERFGNPSEVAVDAAGQVYVADTANERIWRTTEGTTWAQVSSDGLGDANNSWIQVMAVFNNALYIGAQNAPTGAEIWRSSDGTTWEQINADGFGDAGNQWPSLVVYDGYLYEGTANDSTGTQIWRSSDGASWSQIAGDGFGDNTNQGSDTLIAFGGSLYADVHNSVNGTQLRKTTNGLDWTKVVPDGFGDSNNYSIHSKAIFKNRLFLATPNKARRRNLAKAQIDLFANGGEVTPSALAGLYTLIS